MMPSIGFDESDLYVFFGSLLGIKIHNIKTNQLVRVIGKVEHTERFLQIGLYQGKPSRYVGAQQQQSGTKQENDPTFVCSAYKRNRFYLFTQREPADVEEEPIQKVPQQQPQVGRDVFNERIGKEEAKDSESGRQGALPDRAVIYTSYGELHVQLYP